MRFIANILWFILGGVWLGLAWFILGLLLCVTVIGIPLGKQCFKASALTFAPFGKEPSLDFGKHPVANILWLIFFGWEMAIGYAVSGVICCITIIGIPFGLQAFKMMKLAFFPFGSTIVRIKK